MAAWPGHPTTLPVHRSQRHRFQGHHSVSLSVGQEARTGASLDGSEEYVQHRPALSRWGGAGVLAGGRGRAPGQPGVSGSDFEACSGEKGRAGRWDNTCCPGLERGKLSSGLSEGPANSWDPMAGALGGRTELGGSS